MAVGGLGKKKRRRLERRTTVDDVVVWEEDFSVLYKLKY